jgi:hypothetical protein
VEFNVLSMASTNLCEQSTSSNVANPDLAGSGDILVCHSLVFAS